MISTMLVFSQKLTVLLLLLSAIISPIHAQRATKLIYTFSYQFFENTVKNAPSRTDFNDLICLHDEYLTEVYKINSGNDAILFSSTNIGWEFDRSLLSDQNEKPLDVFLAANVTTTDGSDVPSLNALAQYYFDPWEFVPNYLHAKSDAGSIWKNVNSMSHTWEIDVPKKGKLERSICDGTFQESNAGGVTRPPRGETTEAPDTTSDANTIPLTPLTAIEFKFLEGKSREPTLEELDELLCLTDSFFTAWMRDESGDPSADVKGAVVQHFLNPDQTVWVMVAQTVTAQRSQLGPEFVVQTVNAFTRLKVIEYVKEYAWNTGVGSVFKDTTSVSFTAVVSDDPQLAGLEPNCGTDATQSTTTDETTPTETSLPTVAPSIATPPPTITATTQAPTSPPTIVTPAPTTSPTSPPTIGETPAPTVSPTAVATEATQEPTIPPTAAVADTATPGPTSGADTTGTDSSATRGPVFVLDFGLEEGQEVREPTQAEVEDLICKTDQFFTERMRNFTSDTTIESYATYIDWQVNADNNLLQPLQITFLSNSDMSGAPVPTSLVTYIMAVNEMELIFYIENFVWQTNPDSIFQYVSSVEFTDYVDGGPTLGTLERASCEATTASPSQASNNDTPAPTVSVSETQSPTLQPTQPDATPRPTTGAQPTKQPTTDPATEAPTREPATNPDTDTEAPTREPASNPEPATNPDTEPPTREPATNPDSGNAETEQPTNQPSSSSGGSSGQGPTTSEPTTNESPNGAGPTTPAIASPSMVPTPGTTPRPTPAPVVQPQPEATPPSQFKSTGIFPVRPEFLISNLDGLSDENTIRFSSGLDLAWSTFATEIVENVTKHWRASGSRRLETDHISQLRHRDLSIERVPNSAKINAVTKIDCSQNDHLGATCLWIEAEYQYNIVKERYFFLNQLFVNSTNDAIRNGTFQYILQRVSPSTPLIVGAIPREANREFATSDGGSSGGDGGGGGGKRGMSGAGKFFLTLFILLLIFGPIGFYFWKKKQDEEPKLPPYQEEDFVYDFVLPKGVELQTEVDDPGAKGYLVEGGPFGSSTVSSEGGPIDGFEYDPNGYNEYDNDEFEDTDDDWEGEEHLNDQHLARSAESNENESFEESFTSYDEAGGDYSTNNERSAVNDHYHDEDGHDQYSDGDEEAPLVRSANVTRGHVDEARDGAPWEDEDSGYEGETSVQRQGGGQESQEGSGVWTGYDDHLKGLAGIGSSHRGEEESISFGEENVDEGSMNDELVQRQYGDEMVADMMGGAAADKSYDSRLSMESESGWEDTSGASSREFGEWKDSSSDEEDRWA